MFNKRIIQLTEDILNDPSRSLSHAEAYELTSLFPDETADLIMCADKIRKQFRGNTILTCSITNAKSGLCSQDCAFCAQSAHHKTDITVHPLLSRDELVSNAIGMYEEGAGRYSMVTSGYKLSESEIDTISKAAATISGKTGLTVCASLGMLSEPMARKLKEGGITVYHHNLETARSYFPEVCTTHDYDEDLKTVMFAKASGLKVCSGGILGLGETWHQRVELAFTLRELDVDGIPINFLNPIPGTKMAKRPLMSPMEALHCIALFRFINPGKDIIICGGREAVLRDYQSWIFMAGANGLIIGNYLTTRGRTIDADIAMIEALINTNVPSKPPVTQS